MLLVKVFAAFTPALGIAQGSDGIVLTWTNEAPAMALEQNTEFVSMWKLITNTPALTASNTWSIELPLEPAGRFFRLGLQ